MKARIDLKELCCKKRIGILVAILLMTGMISCTGGLNCGSLFIPHTLTISSTAGGTVTTPGEGSFAYPANIAVNLVATADSCHKFVSWTGSTVANPNSPTTTITMDASKTVTANFAPLTYVLSVNSTDGGSVTDPGEGTFTYNCGTVVNLAAAPDPYYGFVEWTGDTDALADAYGKSTTIIMNGDYSVTANFGLFAGGNGTIENPYQVSDWYHLDNIRNYLDSYFVLLGDLDPNSIGYEERASAMANGGKGWQPIGTNNLNDSFVGGFGGQGYEIRDLFIYRPDEPDVGLFGVVEVEGVIDNVGVVAGNVDGNSNVAGLVGKNEGTVANSYCIGNVTGNTNVGGLIGWNLAGIVTDTYSTGSVTGQNNTGGLVGWSTGTISNSYSNSSVTGDAQAGGLAGKNGGTLSNSYSTGSVTGNDNVGGLVGKNDNAGNVGNSYSIGNVTGNTHVGGLIGRNQGAVSNSFWDTETSGQISSSGGTGKTTTEMMDIDTFTGATWNITDVDPGETNPGYIWNIVDDETYPFLSFQTG